MDRVFVTGASGYVGRAFLTALSASGTPVVALARAPDRLSPALRGLPGVTWVAGDLATPAGWRGALDGCDAVVHLAAMTGKARPAEYAAVNVEGTRGLVTAAADAGVRGIVHVSTIAVAFPDQRRYFYAHTKKQAEDVVAASGVPFVVVRPTIVLGPDAPVLAGLAKLAAAPFVPVFGPGTARVQPVDVRDLAAALVALLLQERFRGETLDVGGPDTVTIEELLLRIRRRLGRGEGRVVHVPMAPVRLVLSLLEPLLLPVLPLTCGQLATFANDGVAAPSTFEFERAEGTGSLDATLGEALAGA